MEGGHWGMVEELVKVEGWRSGLTFSSAGTGLEVEETLLADLLSQSVSRQLTLGDLNLLERRGGRGSAAGHAGVGRVLSGAGAGQARQERLLGLRRHHTWTPRCYHSSITTVKIPQYFTSLTTVILATLLTVLSGWEVDGVSPGVGLAWSTVVGQVHALLPRAVQSSRQFPLLQVLS